MQSTPIGRATTVLVVAGALLILAGGVVALVRPGLLLPPGSAVTDGVRVYGDRMAARAIPLGVALLVLLARQRRRELVALLVVAAVVEVGDGVAAMAAHDMAELGGAIVVVAGLAVAARRLTAPSRPLADPHP